MQIELLCSKVLGRFQLFKLYCLHIEQEKNWVLNSLLVSTTMLDWILRTHTSFHFNGIT